MKDLENNKFTIDSSIDATYLNKQEDLTMNRLLEETSKHPSDTFKLRSEENESFFDPHYEGDKLNITPKDFDDKDLSLDSVDSKEMKDHIEIDNRSLRHDNLDNHHNSSNEISNFDHDF
jgi:hypothetical protein